MDTGQTQTNCGAALEAASADADPQVHASILKRRSSNKSKVEGSPQAASEDLRQIYLLPGPHRDAAWKTHPLNTDTQLLQTHAIKTAFDLLCKALRRRRWGLCFYCAPRFGKTWALDMLEQMLQQDHPEICALRAEARNHQDKTELKLYSHLLEAQGLRPTARAGALELRRAFLDFVVATCRANNDAKQVVLMVDEAQYWSARQWTFMKSLVNTLASKLYRIRTLVLCFGQSHLLQVREDAATLDDHGADIVDRFLRDMHEFSPLSGKDELKMIFSQFDDPEMTEHPEDTGICYSEFRLPRAYARGWRLENELAWSWSAIVGRKRKLAEPLRMIHVMDVVKVFFEMVEDADDFKGSVDIWKEALQETTYGSE